jgi:hypothetical protein
MRIARVFPRRTSMTPIDALSFVGDPPLAPWRPLADEVHVSCAFTWDLAEARRLVSAWRQHYPIVRLGGPALGTPCPDFTPGRYVRPGITFTTRGCNNGCPWCLVPEREGRLVELERIAPGHIIQDNNLLQANRAHIERVLTMLRAQPAGAVFSGGLQPALVTDWFAEALRGMNVAAVFLAADATSALPSLAPALRRLSFLDRRRLRVYAMIGYDPGESLAAAEERLEAIWALGAMPFAQLYQPPDRHIEYADDWKALARSWSRPAAMMAMHQKRRASVVDAPYERRRFDGM